MTLPKIDEKNLASYLDFANHHPNATLKDAEFLCLEVDRWGFNSAFVNPSLVNYTKDYAVGVLKTFVKVGTVVAFPIGQEILKIKIKTALAAVEAGADEIDVSANVGLLKEGREKDYQEELIRIVDKVKVKNAHTVVKFIIETGFLHDEEIKKAAEMVLRSGADFVKTCSGWGPRGATLKDVRLIKEAVGEKIKIKVAGGIHTRIKVLDFLRAGAVRIGTSQAVKIVQ